MIALRVGSFISLAPWSAKIVELPFGAVILKWLPLPASKVTPWAFNHRLNSLCFITSSRCWDGLIIQQNCCIATEMLHLRALPNSGVFVSGSHVFFPAPSGLMRIEEPDCFARTPRAFYSWSHEWPSQLLPVCLLPALLVQA